MLAKQVAAASSTDAERAFSEGRCEVNFMQHNTTSQTFKVEMAVGSWDGTPLFPEVDAAIQITEKELDRRGHGRVFGVPN